MSQPLTLLLTAIRTALKADAPLMLLITDVYSGRAPVGAAMNYLVIPDMASTPIRTFSGAGNTERAGRGAFSIRIWAMDYLQVAEIYARLVTVLDRANLDIGPNHKHVDGYVSLTTVFPDPTDRNAVQGVVSYRWMTHTSP